MSSTSGPRFDLPTIENESRPFWDALQGGVLMLGYCRACQRVHYYPRPFCPHCWSESIEQQPASGRGMLYTYSVVHVNDQPPFRDRLPYVAAMVDLEEGVRVSTNIVGCGHEDLYVGMPVSVHFEHITPEVTTAVFRPTSDPTHSPHKQD